MGQHTAKISGHGKPSALPGAAGDLHLTHDSTVAGRAQRIGLMRDGQLEIKQDTKHGAS